MEKRGILFLGAAGVIFGCGFLWHWLHLPASAPETHQICLQDGAQRLAFLESQGQPERCCVATETVQLPAAADGSYSEYAATPAGTRRCPLASHWARQPSCYTYTQSSPGEAHLRTELLLSEDQILLGAVQYDCTQPEQMSPVMQP